MTPASTQKRGPRLEGAGSASFVTVVPASKEAVDDACEIPAAKPGLFVRLGLAQPRPESAALRGLRLPRTCRFVELHDLRELPGHVPHGAHLAWDLDETLCLNESTRPTHTQVDTRSIVQSLQQNHPSFGLTARPFDVSFLTYFDMAGLGIEFAPETKASGVYKVPYNAGHLGGIYFAGHGNPKGDLLRRIVKDRPGMRSLVFVDDQPRNFPAMVEAASHLGGKLSLTCVWYTRHSTADRQVWDRLCVAGAAGNMRAVEGQARSQRLMNLPCKMPLQAAGLQLSLALQQHLARWGNKKLEVFRLEKINPCADVGPEIRSSVRKDIAAAAAWRNRDVQKLCYAEPHDAK